MTERGTFYGLGVGPGDPELITLKAWRIISQAKIIAYPAANGNDSLARKIAAPFIPEDAIELAVALPQTDLEGTFNLAERVRMGIDSLRIPRLDGRGSLSVSASIGVAAVPDCAQDKDTLIMVADAALYRAKRAGKNRTERAAPMTAKTPGGG